MRDTVFEYASRVRSITISKFCLTALECLSVLMLSCPPTTASLFPNLRRLTAWCSDGTPIFAEFLRMALVSSISVLDLGFFSASPALLSVLSSLGTLCPRLQNMAVTILRLWAADDLPRKISPFMSQSISQLHHLHTLSVWDLGTQGIERIMQLRALQSLSLDFTALSDWDIRRNAQFLGFRDLNLLDLSTHTVEHALNFLSSLQVIRSKEIKVSSKSHVEKSSASGSTTLFHLFVILQERCDNEKLECFSLARSSKTMYTEPSVSTTSVFTPLHACRNLTQLVIERVCNFSMSDEELCQLVKGWPKLQVLKISYYVAIDDITMPTFHGLISLLRLCPALTSLALVIDATKLDGIDLKCPSGGNRNKHLRFLALGDSPIKSPRNVALILSGLFPCLEKVDLDCWRAPLISLPLKKIEQWNLVNTVLDAVSVVREWGTET
ncbi:hypothetical protein DFH29DRAFT_1080441 [Suillus ampliporus]|nr:hypothetical protein DFH29DRAFT_1080441 [Suillus ampliporus]